MRKPKISEFKDEYGQINYESYEDAMGDYEDEEYDRMRDEETK